MDIVINTLAVLGAVMVGTVGARLLFATLRRLRGAPRLPSESELVAALALVTQALAEAVDTIPADRLPNLDGLRTKVVEAHAVLRGGGRP